MSDRFWNVPRDDDTIILLERESTLDGFKILHQKWRWDGLIAESYIFRNADIFHLGDQELLAAVARSPQVRDIRSAIVSRTDKGYTFVNFNFES